MVKLEFMGKRILVLVIFMLVAFLVSYYFIKLSLKTSISQAIIFGVIGIFFSIRRQNKNN